MYDEIRLSRWGEGQQPPRASGYNTHIVQYHWITKIARAPLAEFVAAWEDCLHGTAICRLPFIGSVHTSSENCAQKLAHHVVEEVLATEAVEKYIHTEV